MDEEEFNFALWNLPMFHAEKIKQIFDEVAVDYLKTGLEKFLYKWKDYYDEDMMQEIANFLSKEYGEEIKASELFATYAASQAYTLLLTNFFEAGNFGIFEDSTFGKHAEFAKNYGIKLESVRHTDDSDVDVNELEGLMKRHVMENPVTSPIKPWVGFVYLMPVLHNPKGTSLSEGCCKKIVELARRYNFLVICDDVYNIYYFKQSPIKRVLYFDKLDRKTDEPGNVVSIGTLSKIFFPSLRIGWIEGSEWVVKQFLKRPDYLSGAGYNTFNQGLAGRIFKHQRFNDYIKELKFEYKELQEKVCSLMEKNLPTNVTFRKPDGSVFLWLKLPEEYNAADLVAVCAKKKILFNEGTYYSFDGKGYSNYLRIAYTNEPEDKMMTGLQLFCEIVKEFLG